MPACVGGSIPLCKSCVRARHSHFGHRLFWAYQTSRHLNGKLTNYITVHYGHQKSDCKLNGVQVHTYSFCGGKSAQRPSTQMLLSVQFSFLFLFTSQRTSHSMWHINKVKCMWFSDDILFVFSLQSNVCFYCCARYVHFYICSCPLGGGRHSRHTARPKVNLYP